MTAPVAPPAVALSEDDRLALAFAVGVLEHHGEDTALSPKVRNTFNLHGSRLRKILEPER